MNWKQCLRTVKETIKEDRKRGFYQIEQYYFGVYKGLLKANGLEIPSDLLELTNIDIADTHEKQK